jgi:hypothetical protein
VVLLSVLFHIFVSLKSSSYLVAPSFKGSAVLLRTVSVALPCNGSVVLLLINGSVAPSYNGSVAPTYNGSVAPSHNGSMAPSYNGSEAPSFNGSGE